MIINNNYIKENYENINEEEKEIAFKCYECLKAMIECTDTIYEKLQYENLAFWYKCFVNYEFGEIV